MGNRIDCIKDGSYTTDGIKIEGHPFESVCCIYDRETDRTYHLLKCQRCDKLSASFEDGLRDNAAQMYGPILKVAGDV